MRLILATWIALLFLVPVPALADDHEPPKDEEAEETEAPADDAEAEEEEEKEKEPFKPFDEVTEEAELLEGFFDLYQKPGSLLLAIEPDQMGMEFLMNFEIARGVGARGLNGGTMLNIFEGALMSFERHGDKIYLVRTPISMRASDDSDSWQETMEISFDTSVVAAADIQTQRKDDEALLIDIHDWLVGDDLTGITRRVKFAVSTTPGKPGQASLDGKRSYLESAKAFPQNLSFRSKLTFKLSEPPPFNSLADWRSLPLTIHANFVQLPEKPMEPRLGDDRMGYFMTVHKDFSREEETFFTRYVNRWRLEKGRKRGKLWEPKEPITYYIDRTVPREFRSMIKDGVEQWNKGFEAAGWKNAIRAEMLPDDADAEDIRYATIRWMSTDQPQYLAIGPSVVDPRTGEILDADILIDGVFFLRTWNEWERMVDPAVAVEQLFGVDPTVVEQGYRFEDQSFATQLQMQNAVAYADLVARGRIRPGEPMPKEFVKQFMAWLVLHEVGHTLGLRHNFKSSSDTPMQRLHDKAWTEENGLVSSVMDYAAANLAPEGQDHGLYYGVAPGTSDEWVIAYGYTPDQDDADELARQSGTPGRAYGSDEDRIGPGALDPTVNAWDLGADPLQWSKQRTEILRGLIDGIEGRVLVDNAPYADVTANTQYLLGAYATSLGPAVKYVGGQYVSRAHAGDTADTKPFTPVAKSEQKDALSHLVKHCFDPTAFALDQSHLQAMGPNRWAHWGTNMTFRGRIDYPVHEQILGIQDAYLGQLLHPFRLSRMADAEVKFGVANTLTVPELMDSLTGAIFAELRTSPAAIPSVRRNLQRTYVGHLTELVLGEGGRTPADARAMARLVLREVHSEVDNALASGSVTDRATQAHLTELSERIDMALDAEISLPKG